MSCVPGRTTEYRRRMPGSPQDLNAAIRELIDLVRTSDLDGVDLDDEIATLRGIADTLRPRRVDGIRMQAGLRFEPGDVRPGEDPEMTDPGEFFPYSPVVGRLNPVAPPVELRRVDGEHGREIHGETVIGAPYNGPPGCVHGGIIAAVFDEVLGCVCVTNGLGGFTGTLTVVYRNTTPLDAPLTLRGWHDRTEGRKTFARGTLHHGDTLCAEAEGIFIRSEMVDEQGLPAVSPPG